MTTFAKETGVNDIMEFDSYISRYDEQILTNASPGYAGCFYLIPKNEMVDADLREVEITLPPRIAAHWLNCWVYVTDFDGIDEEVMVENQGQQNVIRVAVDCHLDGDGLIYISVGIQPKSGITSLPAMSGENQITLTTVRGYNVLEQSDFVFHPRLKAFTWFVFRNSYFRLYPQYERGYEHGVTGNRPLLGFLTWDTVGDSLIKKLSFLVESSGVELKNFTLRDRAGNVLNKHPAQIDADGVVAIYIGTRGSKDSYPVTEFTCFYLHAESKGWGDTGDKVEISMIDDVWYMTKPIVGPLSQVVKREPAIIWGSVFWDTKARRERGINDMAMSGYGISAIPWIKYSIPPKPFFVEDENEDGER